MAHSTACPPSPTSPFSSFATTASPSPATTKKRPQPPSSPQQQKHTYSVQQLRALASRLDLLKAGSLLLLPSVLPYLASALTALTAASSSTSSTNCFQRQGSDGDINIGVLGTNNGDNSYGLIEGGGAVGAHWWVAPLLSCVGLVLPMVVAKVLASRRRCRRAGGGCCKMKQKANGTTTTCPYARLLNRLGFSGCSSSSSSKDASVLPTEAPLLNHDNQSNSSNKSTMQQRRLIRPRTLLLASLCLWSVLLASAPRLGLNKTVSFTVYSSLDGSFDDALITSSASCPLAAPAASPEDVATTTNTNDESAAGLTSTAWVDISESAMDARVLSAENDEVMDSEWSFPEETLESMTAQQRESLSALRDFWDAMEQVVGDPQEANEIREEFEEQLDEQLQQYQHEGQDETEGEPGTMVITQEELVKEMEEKMMDARDRADVEEEGKVFEYVPWWTEGMLFGISLAIGGVLVALAQARAQTLDLLQTATSRQKRFGDEDDDEVNESLSFNSSSSDVDSEPESDESLSEKGKLTPLQKSSKKNETRPAFIIPRAANRLLLLTALVANFWMINSKYWDLPALLFVGLGSAAVLLAHAWVPHDL
ncbi:hypothetical protein BGZ88_010616 [Linnemannia elongata]|nr:hypothetical protein BGZ88_010616 [Linnemannia elongata]